MRYHNITHDDMRNGDGLRVVLWLSGCNHYCDGCQNPITWNPYDGIDFGQEAWGEIIAELDKPYISGLTLSGGDPLHPLNRYGVYDLCRDIKKLFPSKTIWLYTGYTWEEIRNFIVLKYVDVIVDGEFKKTLSDVNYPWAGSTNQRVIDVKQSLKGEIVLHESCQEGRDYRTVQRTENNKCCE